MDDVGSRAAVALGGTFDPIHDGHRALFHRAFRLGHVTVGLTTDELATRIRGSGWALNEYQNRLRDLDAELQTWRDRSGRCYEIRPLHAATGIAHAPVFDTLVVSPETEPTGRRINEVRRDRGIPPLRIEVVAHVRSSDGEIISSTRIRDGEIDEHGNLTPAE